MLEIAAPTNDLTDYTIQCPDCYQIFKPECGISSCPCCTCKTLHPADLIWFARYRKKYYECWGIYSDN